MQPDKDQGLKKYTYDILLGIILVIHLLTREWPFGNGAQIATDVLLVIAIALTAIRYLKMNRKNDEV